MDPNKTVAEAKTKLEAAKNHFSEDLKKVRTGRAHPAMLDGLMVEVYGTSMSIKQTASITAPEAQLLQITPFDTNNIAAICDAIRADQSLGFNPMDDGRVIRIPIPPLTTERRYQIVKQIYEKMEESLISTRNVRHDALNQAKQAKTDKQIGEDDYNWIQKQIDESMTKIKNELESMAKIKEQEVMTV